MKSPLRLLLALALLFSAHGLQAQLLSIFSNSATNGGSWTYTPATSTISGTEGLGDLIFGTPVNANIGLNRYIQLTANVTTAPAGSFTITIEDNSGQTAFAQFLWNQFAGGATRTQPLNFTSFNFSNIAGWSLDSGASLQPVNASFSQLSAVSVPEPSIYAIAFASFLGLWIARREWRKRQPAAVRITR